MKVDVLDRRGLCVMGVLFFGERLSETELAGIATAMVAILLRGADTA